MNRNITSQISRLDQEVLQQQQLLYQQDFQVWGVSTIHITYPTTFLHEDLSS